MEILKKNSNFMRWIRAPNKAGEVNYGNASEILNMKSNLNFNCEFEGCRELGSLHASLWRYIYWKNWKSEKLKFYTIRTKYKDRMHTF